MKKTVCTICAAALAIASASNMVGAVRLSKVNPKSLCLKRVDIGSNYSVSGSFAKQSAQNHPLFSHSMLKEFTRTFQTKSSKNAFTNVNSIDAVFKRINGATWNLSYLPKHAQSVGSKIVFTATATPTYGDQSKAWNLSEKAGETDYTGMLIAIRVGHFDGTVVALSLGAKFRLKNVYRLAKRETKYLRSVT